MYTIGGQFMKFVYCHLENYVTHPKSIQQTTICSEITMWHFELVPCRQGCKIYFGRCTENVIRGVEIT